jgi:hypothetical protein
VFRSQLTADSHTCEFLYTKLRLTSHSRRNKLVRFGINYDISIPRVLASVPNSIHILLNQAVYVFKQFPEQCSYTPQIRVAILI